jgi:DNA (cytosine-5)-methyltransferase 1
MLDGLPPVAVDLFAGAGGLSLGLEQAGFEIAVAVEYDPIHAITHKAMFPSTTVICKDIRQVTGDELREKGNLAHRDIDLVAGGPPCQGFSLMGNRVLADPRNDLVFHFLKLVEQIQPRLFVMENVPGMATAGHTQLLDELISGFEAAGYSVRLPYRILNAAHHGVPQDRRRLFLLGAREDVAVPCYPATSTAFQPRSKPGITQSDLHLPQCPTVRDAFEGLPDIESYVELFDTDVLNFSSKANGDYAQCLISLSRAEDDHSSPRLYDLDRMTGLLRARHTPLSRSRFSNTVPGTTEPISRFFRLSIDGVSNTLRAGTATDHGAYSAPTDSSCTSSLHYGARSRSPALVPGLV